jgi:para-nitrobenzyl esterase
MSRQMPMAPQVLTRLGAVTGSAYSGAEAFLGLPYAKPPVGARRFAPAELFDEPWSLPRDGSAYGAPCFQTTGSWDEEPGEHPPSFPFVPKPSEDCLFVNVWRPSARPSGEPLPVLVWIHGGGFCGGAASVKWYDGANLATRNNVTVVSLNYRLGPLGFLALGRDGTGGMNGIHDQMVALRWVQTHISAFGGDPSRVTLVGESSGGISVCLLNAAPKASGLFRRAVVQSGPCIVPSSGWGPHTAAFGASLATKLMASLNVSTVEALRALPPQRLQWDNDTCRAHRLNAHRPHRTPRTAHCASRTAESAGRVAISCALSRAHALARRPLAGSIQIIVRRRRPCSCARAAAASARCPLAGTQHTLAVRARRKRAEQC